jgi:RNA polymerase sigma-70 factor (sigma-E family)
MRKADEDRFREFARAQAGILRRSAFLLCGDWYLAEDLVQATLMKMHGAWSRLADRHQPVSYARKTLLRCWLDERRKPWRRTEHRDGAVPERADAVADPAFVHQQTALRDDLLRALSALAPRQRAVLVLRFFESLSVAETADALGCTEGTVKSQTAHGLAAMRTALADLSAAETAPRKD